MIAAIVCTDLNYGIGSKNELLTHIPEDMKMFRELTTNNIIVMGRKTWDSLSKKPLPNRTNVIITRRANWTYLDDNNVIFCDMERIKSFLKNTDTQCYDNIFIIGGGQIYKELLPYCNRIYLTRVLNTYENADTFFPNIDEMQEWSIVSESKIKEYNGIKYQFITYEKGE